MRFSRKNKSKLYYATLVSSEPIYALDENGHKIVVETIDGVDYYEELGMTEEHYSEAVEFVGTINYGGGNAEHTEFGISVAEYDAILTLPTNSTPICETTLIWADTEPTTIPDTQYADPTTSDFEIVKKTVTLNTTQFVLKRIVK